MLLMMLVWVVVVVVGCVGSKQKEGRRQHTGAECRLVTESTCVHWSLLLNMRGFTVPSPNCLPPPSDPANSAALVKPQPQSPNPKPVPKNPMYTHVPIMGCFISHLPLPRASGCGSHRGPVTMYTPSEALAVSFMNFSNRAQ